MKQNERILVYLVTGFLAVILVVAVFFGRDGSAAQKPDSSETVRGLGEILEQKALAKPGGNGGANGGSKPGAQAQPGGEPNSVPEEVTQPPLVATLPVPVVQRVAELLGESRRDRTVRIVFARAGDSLESLVRRWCGARDPFLAEAKALNEELTVLRVGQEVVVPWRDDEEVLAAYEARQPRLLATDGTRPEPALQPGSNTPGFQSPGFQSPGTGPIAPPSGGRVAGTITYTVKPNDSLWKIAADLFGRGNADAMVHEIRRLNPNVKNDVLHPKQKLVVPAGS